MMIHICAPELGLFLGSMVALFLCYMVECVTPLTAKIMISVVIVYDDNKKIMFTQGYSSAVWLSVGLPSGQ